MKASWRPSVSPKQKVKEGEERGIKKRRKKQDGVNNMEDKKPKKNRVTKQG